MYDDAVLVEFIRQTVLLMEEGLSVDTVKLIGEKKRK